MENSGWVKVHLKTSSNAIHHKGVLLTYVKEGFYCVMISKDEVVKYPISNIHKINESYYFAGKD